MKKTKIIGAIVGVMLFVLVIAGLTYAYTIWSSGNINRLVRSECFDVHYDKGSELNGAIVPSYDYTGGLFATVKMNISHKCNVNAKGRLYLDTGEETSSNLFRKGLLNYAVLRNGNTVIASGNITSTGEIAIDVGRLASTEYAFTRYEVYVWIDYNLVENSDINSVYYGSIRAEAIQEEGRFSNEATPISDFEYYLGSETPVVDLSYTDQWSDGFDTYEDYIKVHEMQLAENEIMLMKYIGTSTDVNVPDTYIIDGEIYNVVLVTYLVDDSECTGSEPHGGTFINNKKIKNVTLGQNIKFIFNDSHSCGNADDDDAEGIVENSVSNLFSGCTSLVNAPVIPNSITDMSSTFSGCTSLVNAPVIPSSVEFMNRTFNSSGVTGIVRINSSVVEDAMYIFSGTNNQIEVQVPVGSTTYDTFMGNDLPSNVTITTFE